MARRPLGSAIASTRPRFVSSPSELSRRKGTASSALSSRPPRPRSNFASGSVPETRGGHEKHRVPRLVLVVSGLFGAIAGLDFGRRQLRQAGQAYDAFRGLVARGQGAGSFRSTMVRPSSN